MGDEVRGRGIRLKFDLRDWPIGDKISRIRGEVFPLSGSDCRLLFATQSQRDRLEIWVRKIFPRLFHPSQR
jgi:hypothetical protein